MDDKYNLEFAIKQLWLHETIRFYTDIEGGQWKEATQGCVPSHTHSFKTNCGREWDVRNGWREQAEKGVILPDDPRHPMNSPEAHYKIPIAALAKLPEALQKDFHAIREQVDQVCNEAKEARMFAEYVKAEMARRNMRLSTPFDTDFQHLLRDAYGKFKRPQ